VQGNVQAASLSKASLLTGRTICALMVLFMLFDGGMKVLKLAPAVESTVRLRYPTNLVFAIGIFDLVCVAAFAVRRTSVLGAILLTGYLGGATATQAGVGDPWSLFPVGLGVLVWLGLFLRDNRLRAPHPPAKLAGAIA